MLLFYTHWKHQKTIRFSDVFRGYKKATPGCNGLILEVKLDFNKYNFTWSFFLFIAYLEIQTWLSTVRFRWKSLTLNNDRSSYRRCSIKKDVKNFAKFTRLQACNVIKKENLAQVFSCEFCEISQNAFFTEHLWATASCKIIGVSKLHIFLGKWS